MIKTKVTTLSEKLLDLRIRQLMGEKRTTKTTSNIKLKPQTTFIKGGTK
jgi:hypothetical protein